MGEQTAQPSPQQPAGQEEAECDLVAVEVDGEFSEQNDLERNGQKPEEEGRQGPFQAQIPGMGWRQKRQRPELSSIFCTS